MMLDQTNGEKFYCLTDFSAIIALECRNFKSMECLYVFVAPISFFVRLHHFWGIFDVAQKEPLNQKRFSCKINNSVQTHSITP